MLHVTLQIKDNGIGIIDYDIAGERSQRGLTEPTGYPNEGTHIAIFECPLKQLPMMTLANHTHKEFLFDSRLNFSHWKLVDLDNYMQGNKPFTMLDSEDPVGKWEAKVERLAPDVDLNDANFDEIKGDDDEVTKTWEWLMEMTRQDVARLNLAEPNSNWQIGLDNIINPPKKEDEAQK